MIRPRIALVTASVARDLDEDLKPLQDALRDPDIESRVVAWDDADVDWQAFDIAVLRSTWDYSMRLSEFLVWAQRVARQTCLLNPLSVVRWNIDKHYLGEMADAGVATVPSVFIEPSGSAQAVVEQFLVRHETTEFVVKPAIGAGSRDAQRYAREEASGAIAHARRLLDAQRSVVLQPYLEHVDEHGETALIFFEGRFSHAIRKDPLLRRGQGPTRALFAEEHITPREADAEQLRVAKNCLDAIPFDKPLAYARVDLIHDDDGSPCVLELELTEPSLFFAHAPGSARRFAEVLIARGKQAIHARQS